MATLKLDAETHRYTLDGNHIPGVTELLSCVGARQTKDDPWHSVSGSEFVQGGEDARQFGTALHAVAALMIKGKKFTIDEQMRPWVNGLEMFFADNPALEPYWDGVECSVWSKYGYAGTFDWLAKLNNTLILVDWKTSTVNMPHWRLQTAAYEQAIRERYQIPASTRMQRWTIRIMENDYRPDFRKNNPEDWHNFLSILNTYKYIHKGAT